MGPRKKNNQVSESGCRGGVQRSLLVALAFCGVVISAIAIQGQRPAAGTFTKRSERAAVVSEPKDEIANGLRGFPKQIVVPGQAEPFQTNITRPEGARSALVRERLQAALARLRDRKPGVNANWKPLSAAPEIDRELIPRQAPLSDEQHANLAELQWRSGKQLDFRAFNRHGTMSYLAGMMLEPPAEEVPAGQTPEEATARNFLKRNKTLLLLEDPDREMILEKEQTDDLGYTQLRFSQTHEGLNVWPADVTVQIKPGGHVSLLTGSYVPTPDGISLRPRLSRDDAVDVAKQAADAAPGHRIENAELIIYAPREDDPSLAYLVELHANLLEHWTVVVDAADGDVIHQHNEVCTAAVQGTGTDLSGVSRTIDLWQHNDGFYYMVDTSQPMYNPASTPPSLETSAGVIKIVDAGNQVPQNTLTYTDVRSNSPNAGFTAEAVSASQNLALVYNYYRERFNRNSIDGEGGSILGVVNVQMDNAFWNGTFIALGNGDTWANSLDFNAHEMTHGVISRTSNLVYQNQSGALNEAFADILGEGCEAHFNGGTLDWILGSGLSQGLRSMKDPGSIPIGPGISAPYPKKMSEFLTVSHPDPNVANIVQRDSGGVHFNSSIINHCFYQLTEGLPGAIGLDEGLQIFFRTVTTKLNQQSTFIDCRLGCIAAANELYGNGSAQSMKVAEAFDLVEIYDQRPPTAPTPIPTVGSQDNTLFTFTPDFNVQYLGRLELAQGDGQVGVQLNNVTVNQGSTPSVSGDGSLAVFVDASFDVVLVDTLSGDAEFLGLAGQVYSVSISADGSTYGFVFLDEFFNPTNKVSVVNLATGQSVEYDLAAPIFDQRGSNTASPILFAHVLDFTPDARFLYYDALNRIQLEGGYQLDLWSIYYIDQETGNSYVVIPPVPGANIGNPSLGQAHNHFLVMEVEDGAGVHYVYAADLDSGQLNQVGAIAGGASIPFISRPGYSGDDTALVYTEYSFDQFIGWIPRVDHIAMASNGIEAAGNADIWLNTAVVGMPTVRGVIYRRGDYEGLPMVSVSVGAAMIEEGGADGVFTISRSGSASQALNATFVLTGTAENGVDFEQVPLTADFPAGQSTVEVMVKTVDDQEVESMEEVTLTLAEASHYAIGSESHASIAVMDNDEGQPGEGFDAWATENGIAANDFTGDTDTDAFVHLIEYGLGLDPQQPDGGEAIDTTITSLGNDRFLTLEVRRSRKAPDIQYIVEVSSDLKANAWASGDVATVVMEDSETLLRVRDRTPIGSQAGLRAMRLKIVKP